jgi:hypothetical protein
MDDEHTLREADARLRAALNPGDAVPHRIVTRALMDAGAPRRSSRTLRFASAFAVLAMVLLVAVWRPRRVPPAPPAPSSASAPLAVTGSGSMVVVEHPDGRRWIVGPPPEPRAGGNYVIVLER